MKTLINKRIKEFYGTKACFCRNENHKAKDFASKMRTAQAKLDWLNEFLLPLQLQLGVKIKKN